MDETGQSGDAGAADSGTGADARERAPVTDWSTPESPWSNAGAALDADDDVPVWRRPAAEVRPFTRQAPSPDPLAGDLRPFATNDRPADLRPFESPAFSPSFGPSSNSVFGPSSNSAFGPTFGSTPAQRSRGNPGLDEPTRGEQSRSGDIRPFGDASVRPAEEIPPAADLLPAWSEGRSRYADLLNHLSPNGNGNGNAEPGPLEQARPETLQADDDRRTSRLRPIEAPRPSSAPPYPYEGDLDEGALPGAPQQRAAVPLERPARPVFPAVRPATPGGRRVDWMTAAESARHALEPSTPPEGLRVSQPPPVEQRTATDPALDRPSYDPARFPRRLPSEPDPPGAPAPPAQITTGYAPPTAYSGFTSRSAGDPRIGVGDQPLRALPQRVPAEPDVPTVPEPPSVEPPAETPALARIATHLRRGDVLSAQERQEGFDVKAILEAVREVAGVRDASLRTTPAGAHSLRLDLADGADPAEVSRQVARLLQDRMGLDAAMQGDGPPPPALSAPAALAQVKPAAPTRPPAPPPAAFVPSQSGPPGRAPAADPGTTSGAVTRQQPRRPPAAPPLPMATPPTVGVTPSRAGALETVSSGTDFGPRPLDPGERPGPRVVIENVQVNTFGTDATVEVRLAVGRRTASGVATGPAVDGYLLRLCAMATAEAVDELLSSSDHADGPARCFVEHAASVPFGPMQVAVVVLLLACGGWVEQLAGSAVVTGDDRHAMVRATLAAVNRRLEALLS